MTTLEFQISGGGDVEEEVETLLGKDQNWKVEKLYVTWPEIIENQKTQIKKIKYFEPFKQHENLFFDPISILELESWELQLKSGESAFNESPSPSSYGKIKSQSFLCEYFPPKFHNVTSYYAGYF